MDVVSLVITILLLLVITVIFVVLFRHYYLSLIKEVESGERDIELIDQTIIDEEKKKSKTRKIIKIILKVISYVFLGAVLVGFGFSIYSRASGNIIMNNDKALIVIATGSMSKKNPENTYLDENHLDNQFNAYDIIEIKQYSSKEEVQLYDVVAYKSNDGRIIVHRIIEIVDNSGDTMYLTKGDASSNNDSGAFYASYLCYEDIVGYYTNTKIPYIGSFIIFIQSNTGIATIVALIIALVMYDYYRSKYEKEATKRTNDLLEFIDYGGKEEAFKTAYKETLYYHGQEYSFYENEFNSKSDISIEELKEPSNRMMIVVKKALDGEVIVDIKDIAHDKAMKRLCTEKNSLKTILEITSLLDQEDVKE